MSRIKNTKKNIIYGYISTILIYIINFISRTVFIKILGVTYLGISGLFSNFLGVLSLAELGIGTAMTFSLYSPISTSNEEKLKSLMMFYKRAYYIIALIITVIGFSFMPLLNIIVNNSSDIDNISIYYVIFLINTVSSYFVSYKYSLIYAYQKKYLITNINSIFSIFIALSQIIVLVLFKNYIAYLLALLMVNLLQKIYMNFYINKRYPYLKDKSVKKIPKKELKTIKKNILALFWHRIASISIKQTDNIIISTYVSVAMVGIVSNYYLLIRIATMSIGVIFSSVIGSLGNLIATESKEKQYKTYKIYRFVIFWIYGFFFIFFLTLATPFISLWIGSEMMLPNIVWFLIILEFYMQGDIVALLEMKVAGGVFRQDSWTVIVLAIVNLVVSIIMVRIIGLAGVFIGTLSQRIVSHLIRPKILYKHIFDMKVKNFYIDCVKYAIPVAISYLICWSLKGVVLNSITWPGIVIYAGIVIVVANSIFYLLFRRTDEFKQVFNMIFSRRKLL